MVFLSICGSARWPAGGFDAHASIVPAAGRFDDDSAEIDAFTDNHQTSARELGDDELRHSRRNAPPDRVKILEVDRRGPAEVTIGRLHIHKQADGNRSRGIEVAAARKETASHNQRAAFAAADACRLPFKNASFDSLYCIAVLQHIADVDAAVAEFARVTARGGRVVAVEPDNGARYAFSSTPAGREAFDLSAEFFAAVAAARGESTEYAIGPKVPGLFAKHGIEPIDVRLFPVSQRRLGASSAAEWVGRRCAVERAVQEAPAAAQEVCDRLLDALAAYEGESAQAGAGFVEIQNTMLFATVGHHVIQMQNANMQKSRTRPVTKG